MASSSPSSAASRRKNLGTTGLLDLLVEGVPSPADRSEEASDGTAAFVFKTVADPFAGRITVFRVLSGTVKADSTLVNSRTQGKERLGQLLLLQGKEHHAAPEFAAGDIGAVAKLKETVTGDLLLASDTQAEHRADRVPAAGDELRGDAEGEGRRGEGRPRRSGVSPRRTRRSSCGATSRRVSSCSPA